MIRDGVRNLAFVEDPRTITCDSLQRVRKVRHDDRVAGVGERPVFAMQRAVAVLAAAENNVARITQVIAARR